MDMTTNLRIKILRQNFSETASVSVIRWKEGRITTQELNATDNVQITAILMYPKIIRRTPLTGDRALFKASTYSHIIISICRAGLPLLQQSRSSTP